MEERQIGANEPDTGARCTLAEHIAQLHFPAENDGSQIGAEAQRLLLKVSSFDVSQLACTSEGVTRR